MTNEATVERYFATMNGEEWEEFSTLWTDDALLTPVGARPRTGPEEITAFYKSLFNAWRTHWDQPTLAYEAGDGSLASAVTFSGTTTLGLEVSFDAVDLFHFRDGKICKLANYYDLLHVRQLLATAPS
jgi:ketosteroid isomerase-like protein